MGHGDGARDRAERLATWPSRSRCSGSIVGIALLLSGIGFVILALTVLGKHDKPAAA